MLIYLVLPIPKRSSLKHESSLVHVQVKISRITQCSQVQTGWIIFQPKLTKPKLVKILKKKKSHLCINCISAKVEVVRKYEVLPNPVLSTVMAMLYYICLQSSTFMVNWLRNLGVGLMNFPFTLDQIRSQKEINLS